MKKSFAISAIKKHGMLLVFPIHNKSVPKSLWSVAYPKSQMRWEWDEDGDDRVSCLWHLRENLSRSKEVIYTKWFRGRATFFSRPIFTAMLSSFIRQPDFKRSLSEDARDILKTLESDSPLSTKELKKLTGLRGNKVEAKYNRAMKDLWSKLFIVAFGEIDEGAFPSLAIGSTSVLFERIYAEAKSMTEKEVLKILTPFFSENPEAEKYYVQVLKTFSVVEKKKINRPAFIDFEKNFASNKN